MTIQHWTNTSSFSVLNKIVGKNFNFLKFDCMTVISSSTSITNTIKHNRRASQSFSALMRYIMQRICYTFWSRQILHKLLRMHFIASQNCYPEHERARCKIFAFGTSAIWKHHPPPTLRKKSTPMAIKLR